MRYNRAAEAFNKKQNRVDFEGGDLETNPKTLKKQRTDLIYEIDRDRKSLKKELDLVNENIRY